ncbi:hypothetical protein BDP27DRAFT_1360445 [Rhodocollybia butyracea]|uniref:Uncharacterized protein n=1 Tax=Rhodocollybia butyracea TaxID=206335 RepID=A0A9P5Q1X0_9AGAR|nr:hypothetical protein BDP27DRAFT_1360445 [Rhodocollybia butyracea]
MDLQKTADNTGSQQKQSNNMNHRKPTVEEVEDEDSIIENRRKELQELSKEDDWIDVEDLYSDDEIIEVVEEEEYQYDKQQNQSMKELEKVVRKWKREEKEEREKQKEKRKMEMEKEEESERTWSGTEKEMLEDESNENSQRH